MLKLKNSGYGQKFRKELLDSILKAFQKMQDEDKSGVKPMFRSREWNREKKGPYEIKEKSQLVEHRKSYGKLQKYSICNPNTRGYPGLNS